MLSQAAKSTLIRHFWLFIISLHRTYLSFLPPLIFPLIQIIDEIDFATKVIYEDKNARGLYIENPDVPQTESQWANKQILKKGENRIKALSQNEFSVYIDGEEYSFLSSELKDVRSYVFRINADTPELRIAVEDCLEQLRILYPDYNFSAVYGG